MESFHILERFAYLPPNSKLIHAFRHFPLVVYVVNGFPVN